MPRRTEPAELVAARDVLRANHDAQQDATGAFFNAAARLAAVRREAEALAADQQVHAGKLAELLGVDTAARVTGWSRGRLAEAQRSQRSRRASRSAAAGDAADSVGTLTARGDSSRPWPRDQRRHRPWPDSRTCGTARRKWSVVPLMCTAPLGNNHANPRHPGAVVALVDLADCPVARSVRAGCARRVPRRSRAA